MKKIKKGRNTLVSLLLIAIVYFNLNIGFAQKDTTFWFAAPSFSSTVGNTPVNLQLASSTEAADIYIYAPANPGFSGITVNLAANSNQIVDLTSVINNFQLSIGDLIGNTGLKIESTSPISASYEVNSTTNKEIFSLKGAKALGTNFYTPFQTYWNNEAGTFSSIEIVATEDNTTVLITPRTAITGHAANATFNIILNKGQTYSARDMNVSATSTLSGSIVSANKPIAVTVFEDALVNGTCKDAIGEQLTNIDQLGTKHILHKGTGTSDRVFVMATQNGTAVTVHTSTTTTTITTINWGETLQIPLTDDVAYIETNKPVNVNHVMSLGCELGSSQVPNVYCAGDYSASAIRNVNDDFGIVLYTRNGAENTFTVNGSPNLIQATDFVNVPGTAGDLKIARKFFSTTEIAENTLATIENSADIFGMAVIKGMDTRGLSYSFVSDYTSTPIVNAGIDTAICANVGLSLSGIVGGGSLGGTWSSTGYGTFQNSLNSMTNVYEPSPLDVLINPVRIILTSDGTCPSRKDTLLLTVNQLPIVNASADQTVCANNAVTTLSGNVQGGSTTGTWTSTGGGTFSPNANTLNATYTPTTSEINTGHSILVLTSTNNGTCLLERDTMRINITTPPVVEIVSDTLFICTNNSVVNISGSVSGATTAGAWTSNGNGMFTPNNISMNTSYLPSVADINNAFNWIYLTSIGNGICAAVRDSVYVAYVSEPTLNAGQNQTVCSNDASIELEGEVSGITTTGIWSGGNGTFHPSNTDLNASYTPTEAEISAGQVALTLTSTNNQNCLEINDVVQFLFVAPPYANFSGTDNCLGEATNFTNFSLAGYGTISNYTWEFEENNGSTILNPSYQFNQAGEYTVQLIVENSAGCLDSTTNTVEIFGLPTADFNFSAICENNARVVTFTDQSTSSDEINYWYYDFGGQGTTTDADAQLVFNNEGSYNVSHIVSTVYGCSDSINKQILITPFPEAGFSYNFSSGANVGSSYNFIDTSNYTSAYEWDLGNGTTSTEQNPSTIYFSNGLFPVVQYVYDQLGCFDSAVVWIEINNITTEISTLIPNVISPNGDGLNDVWKLSFIEMLYPNATVEIYNEWGQQLFQSEGYENPWDGTVNGENVPDGNYFYIINLNAEIEQSIFKGALLVLRTKK